VGGDDRSEDWQDTTEFTLTIKRKTGGAISNILHNWSHVMGQRPLTVPLVSTGGKFVLPFATTTTASSVQPSLKVALISGGIGSTPFISMIRGAKQSQRESVDIQWVTSVPYFNDVLPEVLQEIVSPTQTQGPQDDDKIIKTERNSTMNLNVNVFLSRDSPNSVTQAQLSGLSSDIKVHFSRLGSQSLLTAVPDLHDRQILLCGPEPFMEAVKGYLREINVSTGKVLEEDFNF
jgi:ferredoxin-NADP reductase